METFISATGFVAQSPIGLPNKGWLILIKVGVGSMSEDLNRIFSPFEQVENSIYRKFQGTGLGFVYDKKIGGTS